MCMILFMCIGRVISMYYILLLSQMSCHFFFGTTSEVSISIASSSELRSLLAAADSDGGST